MALGKSRKKGKAIKASEDVSSAVRVILLTTLATPVKGQGEERLRMAWDISGILLWLALAVVVLVCCLLAESRKQRRLRILRNQADMASHEVRPVEESMPGTRGDTAPGSHDPVELPSEHMLSVGVVGVPVSAPPGAPTQPSSPIGVGSEVDRSPALATCHEFGCSHELWFIWALHGALIVEWLGIDGPEILWLRETSNGARLPIDQENLRSLTGVEVRRRIAGSQVVLKGLSRSPVGDGACGHGW